MITFHTQTPRSLASMGVDYTLNVYSDITFSPTYSISWLHQTHLPIPIH